MLPVPWVHWDEPTLYDMKHQAHEQGLAIEVVAGGAPGWTDPWSRARVCYTMDNPDGFGLLLVDNEDYVIDSRDVQLARLKPIRSHGI